MYFGRKPRRFRAVASRKSPNIASQSALDVWLQRIGIISQIGLFLFTIGTIYFTVIPLYQKALLDEQIARKQIEMEKLTIALDSAYVKIRSSVVSTYVTRAGAECSGLMISPSASIDEDQGYSAAILEIKPEECLSRELTSVQVKELRPDDLALLRSEVIGIGRVLEELRQKALARMTEPAQTAQVDPHKIPTGPTARAITEALLKGESAEFQKKLLAQITFDHERANVAEQYGNSVRSQVLTLKSIEWPHAKHTDF